MFLLSKYVTVAALVSTIIIQKRHRLDYTLFFIKTCDSKSESKQVSKRPDQQPPFFFIDQILQFISWI